MQPTASAVGARPETTKPQRGERKSVPEIFFVVGDMIILQKCEQFITERLLLVMLLLAGDVVCDCGDIGFADAENAVSGLPREVGCPFFADPF